MKCPTGTFSVGGGELIQRWEGTFTSFTAKHFDTKCFGLQESLSLGPAKWVEGYKCKPWTVDSSGLFLFSGNNSGLHGIESYLMLHLHFVRPGKIWFKFRVDAEPSADGLFFFIDDSRTPISEDYFEFMVSKQLEPRLLSFDVGSGWHSFKWVYEKDLTEQVGLDGCALMEVGYAGTGHAPLECTPCPQGSTSREGAARCSPCPADQIYDAGLARCAPCPGGSYALPGDVACSPRPNCTEDDWQVNSDETC